jgi:hypothetical protein
MYVLYFIGLLPLFVGAVLWYHLQEINWPVWIASTTVGILTAVGFQAALIYGMEGDQQTFSGQIAMTKHFGAWLEHYQYAVYRTETYTTTDSKGHEETRTRQVFDHWEDATRYHPDSWTDYSNIKTSYEIAQSVYCWTRDRFGGEHSVPGVRITLDHDSYMISGDPNDYEAPDQTGFNIPVTDTRTWYNKVKCCPSVFSYAPVPKTIKIFPYPLSKDPFHSVRLLGTAAGSVDLLAFDQMCARLGPVKKVNVILVGFGNQGSQMSHYQEAAWVGGKKNDLVLCFGGDPAKPDWTYCFGWTEHSITKRNLETIALQNGVTTNSLPLFENEIRANYLIKDWKKFDYLTVDPPGWSYFAMFATMLVTQVLCIVAVAYIKEQNS